MCHPSAKIKISLSKGKLKQTNKQTKGPIDIRFNVSELLWNANKNQTSKTLLFWREKHWITNIFTSQSSTKLTLFLITDQIKTIRTVLLYKQCRILLGFDVSIQNCKRTYKIRSLHPHTNQKQKKIYVIYILYSIYVIYILYSAVHIKCHF